MTSGFTEGDASARLSGMAFTGFLHKPYGVDALLGVVRRALLHTAGRSQRVGADEALQPLV